jgi:hypothetical protein
MFKITNNIDYPLYNFSFICIDRDLNTISLCYLVLLQGKLPRKSGAGSTELRLFADKSPSASGR